MCEVKISKLLLILKWWVYFFVQTASTQSQWSLSLVSHLLHFQTHSTSWRIINKIKIKFLEKFAVSLFFPVKQNVKRPQAERPTSQPRVALDIGFK